MREPAEAPKPKPKVLIPAEGLRVPHRVVTPDELGWVRTTNMDIHTGMGRACAWQQPGGAVYIFPPGAQNVLVVREDSLDA